MRLIDADNLIINMDKGMQGTARDYLKFYQMAVKEEPTAYDVDKVIKEMEGYESISDIYAVKGAWQSAIIISQDGGMDGITPKQKVRG